jgi:hypothetical protein
VLASNVRGGEKRQFAVRVSGPSRTMLHFLVLRLIFGLASRGFETTRRREPGILAFSSWNLPALSFHHATRSLPPIVPIASRASTCSVEGKSSFPPLPFVSHRTCTMMMPMAWTSGHHRTSCFNYNKCDQSRPLALANTIRLPSL